MWREGLAAGKKLKDAPWIKSDVKAVVQAMKADHRQHEEPDDLAWRDSTKQRISILYIRVPCDRDWSHEFVSMIVGHVYCMVLDC